MTIAKTIVKFTRPYGRYNRGEVAGFLPAQAERLLGRYAVIHRPDRAETLGLSIDGAAVQKVIDQGRAALSQQAEELARREADLAARLAQIEAREAALADGAPPALAPAPAVSPAVSPAVPSEVAPEAAPKASATAEDLPRQGRAK